MAEEKGEFTLPEPIFDNKDHLKQVIRIYGKHVFNAITISNNMLEFIIANFIDDAFFDESGRILGLLPDEHKLNPQEIIQRETQIVVMMTFFELFINNFTDNDIVLPTVNVGPEGPGESKDFGEGTYGVLKAYVKDGVVIPNKLVKFLVPNTPGHGQFHITKNMTDSNNYLWMIEFCTFVTVMAILIYIDCNLIVDGADRNQCIMKNYDNVFERANGAKNYFLNYCSFLAEIDKPFIKKIPGSERDDYVMGYVVEQYEATFTQKIENMDPPGSNKDISDGINMFVQTCEILKKINDLLNLGIIISHRDLSMNNIMYTKNPLNENKLKVKIIDFGFLCCNIKFKDNTSCIVGGHSLENDNDLDKCNKSHIDLVFFIVWCVRYGNTLFTHIERITGVQILETLISIITLDLPSLRELLYTKNPWDYSAMMDEIINSEIEKRRIPHSMKLTTFRINEMVIELFQLIENTVTQIKEYDNIEIEKTDVGDVFMFDITGQSNDVHVKTSRFFEIYNQNKKAYLGLKLF